MLPVHDSLWQVEKQIWDDLLQKYTLHEFQEMDTIMFVSFLSVLDRREQNYTNVVQVLALEKMCGMYGSIPETIITLFHSAQRD